MSALLHTSSVHAHTCGRVIMLPTAVSNFGEVEMATRNTKHTDELGQIIKSVIIPVTLELQ